MTQLLDIKDVAARLKVSVSHARQNVVSDEKFPKALLLPGRGKRAIKRWRKDEIDEYLDEAPRSQG
jgi:predicted DNA-binding transcriptional regulator AlpA